MLHERIERQIREEKKCAEWAVVSAAEEIAKLFPTDADAYIVERRHDVEFIGDRLLRALAGRTSDRIPKLDGPLICNVGCGDSHTVQGLAEAVGRVTGRAVAVERVQRLVEV